MYPYSLEIDGARAGYDQGWRINRIHRVLGYAQALADLDGNGEFHRKLESVFDDKGTLYVAWKTEPDTRESGYLDKAWGSLVTDYEGNDVVHETGEGVC